MKAQTKSSKNIYRSVVSVCLAIVLAFGMVPFVKTNAFADNAQQQTQQTQTVTSTTDTTGSKTNADTQQNATTSTDATKDANSAQSATDTSDVKAVAKDGGTDVCGGLQSLRNNNKANDTATNAQQQNATNSNANSSNNNNSTNNSATDTYQNTSGINNSAMNTANTNIQNFFMLLWQSNNAHDAIAKLNRNDYASLSSFLGKSGLLSSGAFASATGFACAILAQLFPPESSIYTTDSVMMQLFNLEHKIDGISNSVNTLSLNLNNTAKKMNYQNAVGKLNNFTNLFGTYNNVPRMVCELNDKLGKIHTIDADGKETSEFCNLETPLVRMPEAAVNEVRSTISNISTQSRISAQTDNIEEAANQFYQMVCPEGTSADSIQSKYFEYVDTVYNWEPETYRVKKEFLSALSQMYVNAYVADNACLALQRYDAEKAGDTSKVADIDRRFDVLRQQSNSVISTLDGTTDMAKMAADYPAKSKDGKVVPGMVDASAVAAANNGKSVADVAREKYYTESVWVAKTHSNNTDTVKNLVTGKSYNTNSYSRISAFDTSSFANAYGERDAEKTAVPSQNSTFTLADLQEMYRRFSDNDTKFPEQDRPSFTTKNYNVDTNNAVVAEKGETKVASNIDEEMQAYGFKTIRTDECNASNNKTWGNVLNRMGSFTVKGDKINSFTELGNASNKRICDYISDTGNYKFGQRLTNSNDWVVVSTEGNFVAPRNKDSHYHDKALYGTVFNYKTGEVKDKQLLFLLATDYEAFHDAPPWYTYIFPPVGLSLLGASSTYRWHAKVEFYGFGTYNLGTTNADVVDNGFYNKCKNDWGMDGTYTAPASSGVTLRGPKG